MQGRLRRKGKWPAPGSSERSGTLSAPVRRHRARPCRADGRHLPKRSASSFFGRKRCQPERLAPNDKDLSRQVWPVRTGLRRFWFPVFRMRGPSDLSLERRFAILTVDLGAPRKRPAEVVGPRPSWNACLELCYCHCWVAASTSKQQLFRLFGYIVRSFFDTICLPHRYGSQEIFSLKRWQIRRTCLSRKQVSVPNLHQSECDCLQPPGISFPLFWIGSD